LKGVAAMRLTDSSKPQLFPFGSSEESLAIKLPDCASLLDESNDAVVVELIVVQVAVVPIHCRKGAGIILCTDLHHNLNPSMEPSSSTSSNIIWTCPLYHETIMARKIVFVTGNANKVSEVRAIIGHLVEVEELQGTIEEISKDKCRRAAEIVRSASFNKFG